MRLIERAPDMMASAYRDFEAVDKAVRAYAQLEGEDWYFVSMSGIRELGEYYPSIRDDSFYRKVLRRANQTWGLNPDGYIPEERTISSTTAEPDA